jgi:SAM-dependent methyltransferase
MAARTSYTQYLAAKKSIDDRSLNAGVWSRLADTLPEATESNPLRVLELGCGIGTMVQRCIERGILQHATYTAVDQDAQLIEVARQRLSGQQPRQADTLDATSQLEISLPGQNGATLRVNFIIGEALEFVRAQRGRDLWDLIIAHAFLDLVDLEIVPVLLELLEPLGLFYFSLNFDGLTSFLPEIDPVFDDKVFDLYHKSMDERRVDGARTGGSRTGRRLLERILTENADILQAGSSDWVITPHQGGYTADEITFLQAIVQMVHDELQDHPDLNPQEFKDWIKQRHTQINHGELVLLTHQLDILGQRKR